ncbi:MAG: SdpI family protein [Eubacteriales bacterium]|nr:SdpI family protein [Eubacteriales bacterium]
MKKFSKLQILAWVLAVVPLIMVAVSYGLLPDQVPTHWGFDGAVTYGPKSTMWMIGGMSVLFAVLFPVLPHIDPRRRNYDKFMPSYDLFQVVMMLFLIGMTGVILTETFRPGTVNVGTVVTGLVSLLFVVLGNMLPKFRQNYFSGLKNPWTLASEAVWVRTHRLGGKLLFAAGLLGLASCFLPETPRYFVFFGALLIAVLIPNVMSYIWFRQEKGRDV